MIRKVKLAKLAKGMKGLSTEVERARSGGKIYWTYVKVGERQYSLVTTSGGVHLGLGLLSEEGLQLLCRRLARHFRTNSDDELLLSVENKDCGDIRVFVTMSTSGVQTRVYHLSPA